MDASLENTRGRIRYNRSFFGGIHLHESFDAVFYHVYELIAAHFLQLNFLKFE